MDSQQYREKLDFMKSAQTEKMGLLRKRLEETRQIARHNAEIRRETALAVMDKKAEMAEAKNSLEVLKREVDAAIVRAEQAHDIERINLLHLLQGEMQETEHYFFVERSNVDEARMVSEFHRELQRLTDLHEQCIEIEQMRLDTLIQQKQVEHLLKILDEREAHKRGLERLITETEMEKEIIAAKTDAEIRLQEALVLIREKERELMTKLSQSLITDDK